MPHKTDVARLVDERSPQAERLGAVNCVARRGDRLIGRDTDAAGFVTSLRADADFEAGGRRCVVLGAGGAARAVVLALAEAGAAEVTVVNRSADKARSAASPRRTARLGHARLRPGRPPGHRRPAGQRHLGGDGRPRHPGRPPTLAALADGVLVADLIYLPAVTPLLAAAEARGLRTLNGLGMLVYQAAEAFERWTGLPAPLAEMRRAGGRPGRSDPSHAGE